MYTLFISRGYPDDKYKTYGIFEYDQAKALAAQGCKLVYAAIDLRSIRRWRKWGIIKEQKDGIDLYTMSLPIGGVPKKILSRISILSLKILYNKIIKEHGKPDIMHAHFTNSAYAASKLKDANNIPLVVTEHSSQINKENIDEDLYQMAKAAYIKADKLIAVSPALADMIENNFDKRPVYIPNVVNLDVFDYKEKLESETFNFVSTGNLVDIKRMDLTIEAFYKAFGKDPRVRLTIFGQGPERGKLESIIGKHNLQSQVKLMGLQSREKIAQHLRKSDCFVLASQTETFGLSYVEALAMGLPVIATRCGGPETFVDKYNGYMIDINNLEQLTQAMKFMYNNIDNYDRKAISMEIKEKFSAQAIGKSIIDLYRELYKN